MDSFSQRARKKPKKTWADRFTANRTDPPGWLVLFGIPAAGVVVAIVLIWLLIQAFTANDNPAGLQQAIDQGAPAVVASQTPVAGAVNTDAPDAPHMTAWPGSGAASSDSSSTSQTNDASSKDFKDGTLVDVPIDGSKKKAKIPQGVVNVALASFEASTNGNWDGIPLQSRPTNPSARTDYTFDSKSLRVSDPTVTGDSNWMLIATFKQDSGSSVDDRVIVTNTDDGLKVTPTV